MLMLMDYFEGSRSAATMMKSFDFSTINEMLPPDYSRFVHELSLEIGLTLLELH